MSLLPFVRNDPGREHNDMDIIAGIVTLYLSKGECTYTGEPVTQLEHALQTAVAASRHQARAELITAALLHDIGHFLHDYSENCADADINSQHELVGAAYLNRYFNAEVAELVKQHVNAKRYLVATHSQYKKNLSKASLQSLSLQGGAMTFDEIRLFKSHPLFDQILLLRYWDEGAKIKNKPLPHITEFTSILQSCLK